MNEDAQAVGISYEYRSDPEENVSHSYLFNTVDHLLGPLPPGSTVLDLGCGDGRFIALFHDKGWRCFGTDFSPSGIQVAQQSYPDVTFFLSDAQSAASEILERTGPVDAIISTEVIEHLYNPRAFLQTAYSLLKPGGYFVLTTPFHGYLKNLVLAASGKMDSHFTVLWDHGHIKFWSRESLTIVVKEAGFEVLQFSGSGRVPYLWKSMALKLQKPHSRDVHPS